MNPDQIAKIHQVLAKAKAHSDGRPCDVEIRILYQPGELPLVDKDLCSAADLLALISVAKAAQEVVRQLHDDAECSDMLHDSIVALEAAITAPGAV